MDKMKQRLAAIVALLAKYDNVEEFTDEDTTTVNELTEEFTGLKVKIEAMEKLDAVKASMATPTRKTEPAPIASDRIEIKPSAKELNFGFNGMGDFAMAVKEAANGKFDRRFQNTAFEKNAEDGGFLVPETMTTEVTKKMQSEESLLEKTSKIMVSGNSMTLPIDESAPWNGGVQGYWLAEGAQYTDSKAKLGMFSGRLHKVGALIKLTDELIDDAVAIESYMKSKAPEAIMHKVNSAILSGNGVGKPMGLLASPFRVTVAKESGQSADTVNATNVIRMYSRMIPASRPKAVWYINAAVEEQMRLMTDADGNYIYLSPGSQLNQTPYGMLLGRPVIPLLGAMPALGDEGDIIFADLSYYYSIVKAGGIKQSASTHLFFDRDIQAFKWTLRVDGNVPFKTPVTTEFGSYDMSGIVTLAAR